MTTAQFFEACERHDWYYRHSDDHGVWRRGQEQSDALQREASDNPAKFAVWNAWCEHVFARGPRPSREAFGLAPPQQERVS